MPKDSAKKSKKSDKDGGTSSKRQKTSDYSSKERRAPTPETTSGTSRKKDKDTISKKNKSKKDSKVSVDKEDKKKESGKQSPMEKVTQVPGKSEVREDSESEKEGTTEKHEANVSSDSDDESTTKKSTNKTEKQQNTAGAEKSKNEAEKEKTTKKSDKTKPLKIDTSMGSQDMSKSKSPLPSGTAMDTHPFARGSVIEVLHGVEDPTEDGWWSEDSDEESVDSSKQSVRLCDIIDRVPCGEQKWRYYVHYKDFNRRMDEWISMERIISPPSVGNAKARAIKKEEERQKRKQQREEERKEAEMKAAVDLSAPRASRRRSTMNQPSTATAEAAEGESETPRRTRLQRRKTFDDDTVVASNQNDKGSDGDTPPPVIMAAEKGVVALPSQAAATTTVGEHVVHTISAQELDEHEGLDEASLREHEEVTKVKNVAFLELGAFQMETWYFSPLPKELLSERGLIEVLYVCEFTFSMFSRKTELQRFQSRLPVHKRHPPGNEIYRNGNLSMFEVDGFEERIYCQNLCYIAKLFLDHKTLYFDVDPFLFYVLCEVDERGFHPVGYYSKEKYSDVGYNLACILTFPCHQRKGYGRFLIAFSYELSKKEEKVGSPEKPMSDLGQQAYKPYWSSTIVDFLLNQSDESSLSIMDISKKTSIMAEDIVFTLNQLGILKIINGVYFIAAEEGLLQTLAKKYPVKNPRVDPSKLHWTAFVTDVKRDKFSIHSKKPDDSLQTKGHA